MAATLMNTKCAFCREAREWFMDYKKVPENNEKSMHLEFGVALIAQPMRGTYVLRSVYGTLFQWIAYCPLCGAKMSNRFRQWIEELRLMQKEEELLKQVDEDVGALIDDADVPFIPEEEEYADQSE